jgi:Zn-dependent peptidase ImmA (M78 family)/transcriptional regulator with XRE-family HTH domain
MKSAFSYRLKSARMQSGITQAALAEAIGVTKQAISQFEHGQKNPESSTLIAIAGFFDKTVGYFMRPLTTQLEKVDFRKRASLKGRALEAIKATILDRLEPYLELEQLLGIDPGFTHPLKDFMIGEVDQAEQAAKVLLLAWNLGTNPIPNIVEMLEERNIKVIMVDVDRKFDGLSTMVNDSIPVIVLNKNWDTLRKRFTAMHELGHLVLNFPAGADEAFCEKACNRFAGAMLLPIEVLRQEIGINRTKVALAELIPIKEYYGISLAAMVYRGKELGIFADSVARRFWKMRNQNPELKKEEGDKFGHYPGEERSYRFEQLLAKALTLELVSYSKAAQMAGVKLEYLREKHQLV